MCPLFQNPQCRLALLRSVKWVCPERCLCWGTLGFSVSHLFEVEPCLDNDTWKQCQPVCGCEPQLLFSVVDKDPSWKVLLSRALGCSRTLEQGVRPAIVDPVSYRWGQEESGEHMKAWTLSPVRLAGFTWPWWITFANTHGSFSVCPVLGTVHGLLAFGR